jgi:hypothetical protein
VRQLVAEPSGDDLVNNVNEVNQPDEPIEFPKDEGKFGACADFEIHVGVDHRRLVVTGALRDGVLTMASLLLTLSVADQRRRGPRRRRRRLTDYWSAIGFVRSRRTDLSEISERSPEFRRTAAMRATGRGAYILIDRAAAPRASQPRDL